MRVDPTDGRPFRTPSALPRPSALPLLALVDADPESNPANWQWVAGSGADAAPYFRVKGAGLELGTAYPGPIIDRRGAPRTRAESLCESARDVSTPRHPLYTPANPAIVASLTTLGDDMDDEKPDLEPMPDAMSSDTEAPKEAKPAVKKRRKTAAKKVAKKVAPKKKAKKAKKAAKKSAAKKSAKKTGKKTVKKTAKKAAKKKKAKKSKR